MALATGIAVAALIPADAVGNPDTWNQPITLSGEYYLYSEAQKDNKPLYAERWQFNDDCTLTVYSGQEIVTGRFRTELKSGDHGPNKDHWLILEYVKTNGLPDCEGRVAQNAVPSEVRYIIWHAMNGGIELCFVEHLASTGFVPTLRCIAALFPVDEKGAPSPRKGGRIPSN